MNSVRINNNYKNLDLSKIDSYGSHISIGKGLQGRISSLLHWEPKYDQRNLAQYYIESAQTNPKSNLKNLPYCEAINQIKKLENFNKFNSREIAQLIVTFESELYNNSISSIISKYIELKKDNSIDSKSNPIAIDINTYIESIQNKKNFKTSDLESIIQKSQEDLRTINTIKKTLGSINTAMKEGFIWESLCTFVYTTLAYLSFSTFWTFFWAGTIAELSLTKILGWSKKALDDNSFHPITDAVICGLWITISWLLIDELESTAKVGSLLYLLSQRGINNYVLKYSTMNLFFALKAQLHQGNIKALDLFQAFLSGAIRGLFKNPMLYSMNHPVEGLKYLVSALILEFKCWLENLISAPKLIEEIVLIFITNFSKLLEIIAKTITSPLIQKAYDYRGSISLALIAIIIGSYNPQFFTV